MADFMLGFSIHEKVVCACANIWRDFSGHAQFCLRLGRSLDLSG